MATPPESILRILPPTFTYTEARRAGLSDRLLYRLRDEGVVEAVSRGLFQRVGEATLVDTDLLAIARRAPMATLCLVSALARHGLTDEIPASVEVALPRGTYRPRVRPPVTWHAFDAETFDIGRARLPLTDDTAIGLFDAQRSIIDAIRLRHREGAALAYEALRRWLTRRGSSPSQLLAMARRFRGAEEPLREALEVLL